MLTGKLKFDTKWSKEQLFAETEVDGKKEWREINTLPGDHQKQIIASNSTYAKYLNGTSVGPQSVTHS